MAKTASMRLAPEIPHCSCHRPMPAPPAAVGPSASAAPSSSDIGCAADPSDALGWETNDPKHPGMTQLTPKTMMEKG